MAKAKYTAWSLVGRSAAALVSVISGIKGVKDLCDGNTQLLFWFCVVIVIASLGWGLHIIFGRSEEATLIVDRSGNTTGTPRKVWRYTLIERRIASIVSILIIILPVVAWLTLFRPHVFPKGEYGILVLKILGDDDKNSLQRDLVDSLRNELELIRSTNIISVIASDVTLNDSAINISEAHENAQRMGKRVNAQLVLWGDCIRDKKFWPRITIVNKIARPIIKGDRELDVQEIDQLQLPPVLVNEPVYLSSFICGLFSYETGNYSEALECIDSANNLIPDNSTDKAIVLFYAATCRYQLAETASNPKDFLQIATRELYCVTAALDQTNSPKNWAVAQINLGIALHFQSILSEGAASAQLLADSIQAFQKAQQVFTFERFPKDWANSQVDLGNAWRTLGADTEGAQSDMYFEKAIKAFGSAQQVYSQNGNSEDCARVQQNIGLTIIYQARQNVGAETTNLLYKANYFFHAALKFYTRDKHKQDWAEIQVCLGMMYRSLAQQNQGIEASNLLNHAIQHYRDAIEACSNEPFPRERAEALSNLGNALHDQAEQAQGSEAVQLLGESIQAFTNALGIFARSQSPQDWAQVESDYGAALVTLAIVSKNSESISLLQKAVDAYQLALDVRTRKFFPQDWAQTQNNLGFALFWESVCFGDNPKALKPLDEAIIAFRHALEVQTRESFQWPRTAGNLANALCEKAQLINKDDAQVLLEEAISIYRTELEIYTPNSYPDLNNSISKKLSNTEQWLQALTQHR